MRTGLWLVVTVSLMSTPVLARETSLPMPLAQELPVEVQLTQQEVAVDVLDASAGLGMQFGLIGALVGTAIENSEARKAEVAVQPLRNLMVRYDFEQRLVAALQARLPGSGIAERPQIVVAHVPWEARTDLQQMPARALVIRPRYALDTSMSTLYVKLQVSLEDRNVRNGTVRSRRVFDRPYTFRSTFATPAQAPGASTRWTGLGEAQLGALMDQSVEQAVALLIYDFSAEGRQQWALRVKEKSEVAGRRVPGRTERHEGGVPWVRAGNRRLQSLVAYQTLQSGQPVALQRSAAVTSPYVGVAGAQALREADRGLPPSAPASSPAAASPTQGRTSPPAHTDASVAPSVAASVPSEAAPRNAFWESHRAQPVPASPAPATTP